MIPPLLARCDECHGRGQLDEPCPACAPCIDIASLTGGRVVPLSPRGRCKHCNGSKRRRCWNCRGRGVVAIEAPDDDGENPFGDDDEQLCGGVA